LARPDVSCPTRAGSNAVTDAGASPRRATPRKESIVDGALDLSSNFGWPRCLRLISQLAPPPHSRRRRPKKIAAALIGQLANRVTWIELPPPHFLIVEKVGFIGETDSSWSFLGQKKMFFCGQNYTHFLGREPTCLSNHLYELIFLNV